MNLLIKQEKELEKHDVEILSIKLTNYLIEATSTLVGKTHIEAMEDIGELNKRYFEEHDPTIWNYIDPNYLTN